MTPGPGSGSGAVSATGITAGGSVFVLGEGAVVNQDRQLDAARIRAHLTESSERKRDEDLAAADQASPSTERERLRGVAMKADAVRKARIDDLVNTFVALDDKTDSTPVLREMTRILSEEGVDAALAYIDGQRGSVLDRIKARDAAVHLQNRADLQPLLQAAGLQAAKGQNDLARKGYRDVLGVEPQWPEALEVFGWFLVDQSVHSKAHRPIGVAYADSQEALAVAQAWYTLDRLGDRVQRLLCAALEECGDVLRFRGQPGDADQAFKDYALSVDLREGLLKANPNSNLASRDVSVGVNRLADILVARGLPGDPDRALALYTRGLDIGERILAASPGSPEAARDVSVSLNKLADYLVQRGRSADLDLAYKYYTRGLELADRLMKASPGSALAARDVSVSLGKLGQLLENRGLPGDVDEALRCFTRGLQICEDLYKANPDSMQTGRDVSVCLERVGDFYALRAMPGDAPQALASYSRCLEIREGLLKSDPDSAQAKRDLFVVLNKVGDMLVVRNQPGDADAALANYTRSLELTDRLLEANPGSAMETRDVSVCLNKVGDRLILRNQPGDAEEALKHYVRSKELAEGVLKANPDSVLAARDVFICLNRVGLFFAGHGKPENAEEALGYARRSLEITDGLLKENPSSLQAVRDVCISLNQLGVYYASHGQPDDAKVQFQRLNEMMPKLAPAAPPVPVPVA
jgi:tetratricopeptide (TPR) repeat protein